MTDKPTFSEGKSGLRLKVPVWVYVASCPDDNDALFIAGTYLELLDKVIAAAYDLFVADEPDETQARWETLGPEAKAKIYMKDRCDDDREPADAFMLWEHLEYDIADLTPAV